MGFTSHQPVYALKSTGQNVFFVTFNQLWVKFTEFKELSSHNYEQNVPWKGLVGKFHFSEILPNPKLLQKGLIYRTTRSCKSDIKMSSSKIRSSCGVTGIVYKHCSIAFYYLLHFILLHPIPNVFSVPVFFTSNSYLPGASWLAPGVFVHLHTVSETGASANCHDQNSGDTARIMGLLWDCNLSRL